MMLRQLRTDWILSERGLPWLAAFLGALLAGWVILQAHGAINSDGIMYVEISRLFSMGQWREGLAIYNWPLYPLLIMMVHKLSGLGLQASAHALAMIAFAMTSGGLLVLVREIGGDRRTMQISMLLLFASPYMVGTILPMVVRDQLFWAAHVWSLVFFLRFYRECSLRSALGWGAIAVAAVLMRIEALIYLMLLPLALLADSTYAWWNRWFHMIQAHALLLLMILGAIVTLVLDPSLRLEHLGRLHDPVLVAAQVYDQLTHGLEMKSRIFAEDILGSFLQDYALTGILLTLGYVLLNKAASVAGWLQLGAAVVGRLAGDKAPRPSFNPVFAWLIILGLVNAVFIILANFLLPKRYLMPIAFVILVFAAFGLRALYDTWRSRSGRGLVCQWGFLFFVSAFAIQLLVIVRPSDPGKLPQLQAAHWLSSHVPDGSRIYYDSRRVRYYVTGDSSDRTEDEWPVVQQYFTTSNIRQFDYMVVRISRKAPERQEYLSRQVGAVPVAAFDNGRGDKVLIYRAAR